MSFRERYILIQDEMLQFEFRRIAADRSITCPMMPSISKNIIAQLGFDRCSSVVVRSQIGMLHYSIKPIPSVRDHGPRTCNSRSPPEQVNNLFTS